MLTVTFRGTGAPPNPWSTDSGSILRSTLTTGNGAVIGVKNDQGNGTANANIAAHNMSSNINVVFDRVIVRLPVNPTNTGVDLSHTYNPDLASIRVDTDDFGAGGLNPNLVSGVPDILCTQPTTATSYGIKLPMDFLPSDVKLGHVTVLGFYNGIRLGELVHGGHITIGGTKVGLAIEGATWPSHLVDVMIVSTTRKVKSVGVNPELAGISGANTNAGIYIDELKLEDDSLMGWAATVYDIDDGSDYLSGRINVFGGATSSQALPAINGGTRLAIGNLTTFNGLRVDHWKSYTPTVAAQTGTFTSVTAQGQWRQIDVATVAVQVYVHIVTNGTAAGYVTATLPVTAPADFGQTLSARAAVGSLVVVGALVPANSNSVVLTKYDGTYPGGTGVDLIINGIIRLTP
jgi:hypothetical protein